jgi:hypothetical protein
VVDNFSVRSSDKPELSVIVPLFGAHRGVETLSTIGRAWLGQNAPCEVIVAVAGAIYDQVSEHMTEGAGLRLVRGPLSMNSIAPLRNLAARQARARLLYFSDADILPLGRDYLRGALNLLAVGRNFVCHPWMYRLVHTPGWRSVRTWKPLASRSYFVTADPDGTVRPWPGERLVWRDRGLLNPPADPTELPDAPRPHMLYPCHWGGLLIERELFEAVGGYCTGYVSWGGEDHDMLIKLLSCREKVEAWRTAPALTCLHFEHPHAKVDQSVEANRALLKQRRTMGVEAMVQADIEALPE